MMYLVIINWKASSSSGSEESEDNLGSNGSMPASVVVDELFKSTIMFDTITRSLERNLSGVASGDV